VSRILAINNGGRAMTKLFYRRQNRIAVWVLFAAQKRELRRLLVLA
jgi:hypothetical protein